MHSREIGFLLHMDAFSSICSLFIPILFSRLLLFLTKADFLSRVGRQQEDQQGHGGEEDARDEEVESVVQGSPS